MAIHVCSTGQTFKPRRLYLTGDITKLNPFIQVRWNDHLVNYFPLMYRYGINIYCIWHFLVKILIILYKMLIITGISTEKTNELTIYGILSQNVTLFYRQQLVSLFQVQEKSKACRISKLNFSNSCFIADDSYVNIVWQYVIVFS